METPPNIMKPDPHVRLARRSSTDGQWMLTRLIYPKVQFDSTTSVMTSNECCFPVDVAFKVGGSTSIKYLVLQVHYASIEKFEGSYFIPRQTPNTKLIFSAGETDRSGLVLTTSPTP